MAGQGISPKNVTKPIQLLAAWLVGLIVVNGALLGTAVKIDVSWERSALVLAAIFNVPLFLAAIFLLQTKFRPELQEDAFYSKYISRKSNSIVSLNKVDVLEERIVSLQKELQRTIDVRQVGFSNKPSELDWSDWRIAINDYLPFFKNIRAAFKEANIPVALIFGQVDKSGPLKNRIISISQEMDHRHVAALLNVLAKFAFDGINFWYPVKDVGETEDVYIGSYGVERPDIPFTDEVKEAFANAEPADVSYIVKKHKISPPPSSRPDKPAESN